MNKLVSKLVSLAAILSVVLFQACKTKESLVLTPVENREQITISADSAYTEVIPTKQDAKDMQVKLKIEFDESNNVLTVSLTSGHNLFGFKNDSKYKNVIRNKKISLKRLPYKVQSEPEMTYRLSKSIRKNIPGPNDKHIFKSWVSTTGLHPQIADYVMVAETLEQKYDIVADTIITMKLGDIMMMDRSVSKKNRYDLFYYTNLDKDYEINIKRNPCLGKDEELASTEALLNEVKENYTNLKSKYPEVENLTPETLMALEEVRVKLEAQYQKKETTNECPKIQTMLEEYNLYVDSIAKLAEVKAQFAHKRPRLSVPADQLLAVARMVDNNVASWLVSHDVVEKSDLVKRNRKLIDDINKKLSKNMRMDSEQSTALSVFKKAEKYFNDTCLSNKKR
ncbi:MAG: hypothetical protein UIC45_06025 [Paludibacteraceae bacterium]|nr:hypothetical protein [Paludibacteraceae bacterium]